MLECSNGVRIIQSEDELPFLEGEVMYLDLETTSKDPKLDSLNPWHHCWIAGICIAVDSGPVYYIPVAHHAGRNVDCVMWLAETFQRVKTWVNHNIKYDAHVIANHFNLLFRGEMIDTVVLAKLLVSDRMSYSLDSLMTDWLPNYPGKLGDTLKPYLVDNKDYGRIPIDILGEYGGGDIFATRTLYHYLMDKMPEDCLKLMRVEIGVTKILFDTERLGMRTTPDLLKAMNFYYITQLLAIEKKIQELSGYCISPHINADCYDLLCNGYGLPVLKWTQDEDGEDKNPSFAKDALQAYLTVPGAPTEVVKLMLEYRQMHTFRSLFLETYIRLHVDGLLHPDVNQTVRTGRMSVRRPNSQQLNKNAKKLIIPYEGCSFLSVDYSQIEFRLIVHYTQTASAIIAYNQNPDTDFHQWVADMCGIPRKPAKTVNFCMGYGGGKEMLLETLSKEPLLLEGIKQQIEAKDLSKDQMLALFKIAAMHKAEQVYNQYHAALPNLKTMSRNAAKRAEARGYVFNLFGRRRHLDKKRAHLAFNALNQSTAADIMKSRLIPAWDICQKHGLRITALVHDEILFHGPTETVNDPSVIRELIECLEQPEVKLAIPLRCTYGTSSKSWYEAGLPELKWPLEDCPWHNKKDSSDPF